MLAFQMQQEELSQIQQQQQQQQDESTHWIGAVHTAQPPRLHPLEQQELSSPHERARRPGAIPENRPPARHPMGPDADDYGSRAHVGNQAFDSFRKTKERTSKGVATHDTGRDGSDSDAIKGKAMDPHMSLQMSWAVNSGLIDGCNGAVNQGKEAIVYHADRGAGSNGFDVAVKVFKRMQEFRGRGEYVDGDPRYAGRTSRNITEREQLEFWTEKEFRNLVRANRAMVPVPTPLHHKDNIIFMRFMGNGRWPAPQIREIEMRKGSKKWDVLYTQVMEAIRR
jgi:serine/threonine-protein kinase RIO1